MITLLKREFTVHLPAEAAWEHLSRIEAWPSWARHIKTIELTPAGQLGPESTGVIRLTNGMQPRFRVTTFDRPRSWQWGGAFLWLTVHYDHLFQAVDSGHTKLTWIIQASGLGASILGPLFARLYRPSLDRAIPLLVQEMNAAGQVSV